MKFLAILLIIVILVAVAWMAVMLGRMAANSFKQKKADRWTVVPRSGTIGGRELRPMLILRKPGEQDFLFWPTEHNADWDPDRALLEAEIQATEMNRMHEELTR